MPEQTKFFPGLLEPPELNETDAELLDLLAVEGDCSDMLQNIASNEQFERLINSEGGFEQQESVAKANESRGFKCAECGRICTTRKLLKSHLLTHSGVKSFVCNVCGKAFKRNYERTAHMRSHGKPTFQCDVCAKMFLHRYKIIKVKGNEKQFGTVKIIVRP